MSNQQFDFDSTKFSAEFEPELGILRLIYDGEIFSTTNLMVLALCAQQILKRREEARAKDGTSQ